jgi:hypothetical protein
MEYAATALSLCGIIFSLFMRRNLVGAAANGILLLGVILYFGTRLNFGNDYFNYEKLHICSTVGKCDPNLYWEPFYSAMAAVLYSLGVGFGGFLLVIAFLSLSLKYIVFSKVSYFGQIFFWLYVGIYGLPIEAGSIRQGLSIALLLASALSLTDRRYFMGLIFVFFAVNAHISAILAIPFVILAYFLAASRLPLSFIFFCLFLIFGLVLWIPFSLVTEFIMSIISTTGVQALASKASFYLSSLKFTAPTNEGIVRELKHLVMFILFFGVYKSRVINTVFARTTSTLFLCGIFLVAYFGADSELGTRLPAYFIPLEVIPLGSFLFLPQKRFRIFPVILLAAISIILIIRNMKFLGGIWGQNYSSYQSWLFL